MALLSTGKRLEKIMKVGFYQKYDAHQKPYASIIANLRKPPNLI
jgi:hypothetical protein